MFKYLKKHTINITKKRWVLPHFCKYIFSWLWLCCYKSDLGGHKEKPKRTLAVKYQSFWTYEGLERFPTRKSSRLWRWTSNLGLNLNLQSSGNGRLQKEKVCNHERTNCCREMMAKVRRTNLFGEYKLLIWWKNYGRRTEADG